MNNTEPQHECIYLTCLDQMVSWPDELAALLDFSLRMDPLPSPSPSFHLSIFLSSQFFNHLELLVLPGPLYILVPIPGVPFSLVFARLAPHPSGPWDCSSSPPHPGCHSTLCSPRPSTQVAVPPSLPSLAGRDSSIPQSRTTLSSG